MVNNILKCLTAINSGIDPYTGELFDAKILSDDSDISKEILELALLTQVGLSYEKKRIS